MTHVDDMFVIGESLENIRIFKDELKTKFEFKDKGNVEHCLGINFRYMREEAMLFMNQTDKIDKAYELVKEDAGRAYVLPLQPDTDLDKQSDKFENITLYQSVIGMLNYISLHSRLDIAIYVNQLARYIKMPTHHYYQLAVRVVTYLYSTRALDMC